MLGTGLLAEGTFGGPSGVRVPIDRTRTRPSLRHGAAYHGFLTAVSPIEVIPDHEASDAIIDLVSTKQADEKNPFEDCPMVHMARLLVIDDLRPALGESRARSLKSRYLMFVADIDGSVADFLDCFYDARPDFVHEVWGRCLGYPQREQGPRPGPVYFRRYIGRCSFKVELPFAAFPEHSVREIKTALDDQDRLLNWIAGHHLTHGNRQAAWNNFIKEHYGHLDHGEGTAS